MFTMCAQSSLKPTIVGIRSSNVVSLNDQLVRLRTRAYFDAPVYFNIDSVEI